MSENHRVLILPGWLNSGPAHWQSRWELLHGDQRVQQHDWQRPLRGDWMAQLEEAVLSDERPAVLVAHSLGCHLVAAWAAHSAHTARVAAALLVAPPDLSPATLPAEASAVARWYPPVLQRLPFVATLVYSSDDPYASTGCSQMLAAAWGAAPLEAGALGHLNGDSGLGDWPEGRALIAPWLNRAAG